MLMLESNLLPISGILSLTLSRARALPGPHLRVQVYYIESEAAATLPLNPCDFGEATTVMRRWNRRARWHDFL